MFLVSAWPKIISVPQALFMTLVKKKLSANSQPLSQNNKLYGHSFVNTNYMYLER